MLSCLPCSIIMISVLCFVHEQNRGPTSLGTERVVYTRHNDIGLSGDYMNKLLRRKFILFGHDVTWLYFRWYLVNCHISIRRVLICPTFACYYRRQLRYLHLHSTIVGTQIPSSAIPATPDDGTSQGRRRRRR